MLFRKKIERSCAYCSHCGKVDEQTMLCKKKGLVSVDNQCRCFKYDPLKRVPKRAKPQDFAQYPDENFSL